MSSESIRRWARTEPVRDDIAGLVPVHVIAEAAPAKTLTVWSPAGYGVGGLSVGAAAELLRRLA